MGNNMIKKPNGQSTIPIALGIVALVISIFSIILHFVDQKKVVYIDSIALMNGYKGMQQAKEELEKKISIYQGNLDTLKLEFEEKISEYEIKKGTLTKNEKALFEELLATKEQQLNNYQKMVEEKIQGENQMLTQKVLGKINDYVKRFGKENNLNMILAATQYGNVVYGDDSVEITEQVVEGLNKEYSQETAK